MRSMINGRTIELETIRLSLSKKSHQKKIEKKQIAQAAAEKTKTKFKKSFITFCRRQTFEKKK